MIQYGTKISPVNMILIHDIITIIIKIFLKLSNKNLRTLHLNILETL